MPAIPLPSDPPGMPKGTIAAATRLVNYYIECIFEGKEPPELDAIDYRIGLPLVVGYLHGTMTYICQGSGVPVEVLWRSFLNDMVQDN